MSKEQWEVVRHSPKFKVSNTGEVKYVFGDKSLTGWIDSGYHRVQLMGKSYFIHRLVAEYFVENPRNKPEVNHIDGNKLNNHFSNLEWVTSSENKKHALETGLIEGSNAAKLSASQVRAIRNEINHKIKSIANQFDVSEKTIQDIAFRKTWKNVS